MLSNFQWTDTKLKDFLPKNQRTKRKLLKIGVVPSCQLLDINLVIKLFKDFESQILALLTPYHYTNSQNSKISFVHVDFFSKIFLMLASSLKTWQPLLPWYTKGLLMAKTALPCLVFLESFEAMFKPDLCFSRVFWVCWVSKNS